MTSSSELLPPFSARDGCGSGRLNDGLSRPEDERNVEAVEAVVDVDVRPLGCREPENRGWEKGTGKPESMLAMLGFIRNGGREEEEDDDDGTDDEEDASIPAWVVEVVLVEQVGESELLVMPSPRVSVGNMAWRSPSVWPACCRRCDLLPSVGGVK